MIHHGTSDLAAYLVASHHGKVRLSIRSLPDERVPQDDRRFARGVWEGDVLSTTTLGDGAIVPQTTLSLELMELGASEAGPSWLERTLSLRDQYGPFRLAYMEALLRVADCRASDSPSCTRWIRPCRCSGSCGDAGTPTGRAKLSSRCCWRWRAILCSG